MNWELVGNIATSFFVLGGATLCFFGGLGLLRFPDMLSRLHAATKPQILGMIFVFIGVGIHLHNLAVTGMLVLMILFQITTAPVAAHMLARAAYRTDQIKGDNVVLDELAELYWDQD